MPLPLLLPPVLALVLLPPVALLTPVLLALEPMPPVPPLVVLARLLRPECSPLREQARRPWYQPIH